MFAVILVDGKYPPKCIFEMEKLLSNFPVDMGFSRRNKLNIDLKNSNWLYEVDMNLNLAETLKNIGNYNKP